MKTLTLYCIRITYTLGNINAILDKEEESFMKEHQFSLDENFQAPNQCDNLHDFSTYRTSIMTIPDDGR